MAIADHQVELVDMLLASGVQHNQPDKTRGWTPLHHAVFSCTTEQSLPIVQALLAKCSPDEG
jgi:hypothetical protein